MEQFVIYLFERLDVATIIVIGILVWSLSHSTRKEMRQLRKDSDEKFHQQTVRIDELYQLIVRMLEKKDK